MALLLDNKKKSLKNLEHTVDPKYIPIQAKKWRLRNTSKPPLFPSCYCRTFPTALFLERKRTRSPLPSYVAADKKGGHASLRIANFRQVFVREIQPTVFAVYKVALEDRVDS